MENDIRELSLDELDQVAGGRYIYDSEELDFANTKAAVSARYFQLKKEGREDEARALYKRLMDARLKWSEAISNARQDSAAIPFSRYFKLD